MALPLFYRFKGDIVAVRKIQAAFRGYFTREHWEHVYETTQVARAEFFVTVDKGKQLREVNLVKNFRRRLYQWRDNVVDLKIYKQSCAISIQTVWRSSNAQRKRRITIRRMKIANNKYFLMCELHHNLYRLEMFNAWKNLMRITRCNRCATILAKFITTSERRKKFYWAGRKLRRLLGIRKKHHYKVVMRK